MGNRIESRGRRGGGRRGRKGRGTGERRRWGRLGTEKSSRKGGDGPGEQSKVPRAVEGETGGVVGGGALE